MRRHHFVQGLFASALAGRVALAGAQSLDPPPLMRIAIPANAGGGWDATGRALGRALVQSGQARAVRYDNRGGAAGTLGLAQFATHERGQADALMVMGSVLLGGLITGQPPVGLDRVQPLARLTNEYNVFVLPAGSPFGSMAEVLQQFRAHPASIKWGGGSRGSTEHIAIHMMARVLGIPGHAINYIPFRGGGEAAAAIVAGLVTVGGSGLSEFRADMAAGRMQPVAVTAAQRLPEVAQVPTLRELGMPVTIGNWRGVCAAGGLTVAEREHLEHRVRRALSSPDWHAETLAQGWIEEPLFGVAFEQFVREQFSEIGAILRRAGLA